MGVAMQEWQYHSDNGTQGTAARPRRGGLEGGARYSRGGAISHANGYSDASIRLPARLSRLQAREDRRARRCAAWALQISRRDQQNNRNLVVIRHISYCYSCCRRCFPNHSLPSPHRRMLAPQRSPPPTRQHPVPQPPRSHPRKPHRRRIQKPAHLAPCNHTIPRYWSRRSSQRSSSQRTSTHRT